MFVLQLSGIQILLQNYSLFLIQLKNICKIICCLQIFFRNFVAFFFGSLIIVSKKKFSALFSFQIKDVLNIDKALIKPWWIANLCLVIADHMSKIYFIIDQQIARHFVHYSECLDNPPSLLSNSNSFLLQGSQPITIKGWDFSQSGIPLTH